MSSRRVMGGEAAAQQIRSGGRPTLQEAEARMDRLLSIARRHFLAAGYRGASIDGICREAGVAKKTIYHHFGSKAGLFTAIIETLRRKWIAELSDIVLQSHHPEQVLEAVALHLLDVGTRPEMIALYRLFVVESYRFPDLSRNNYDRNNAPVGMEPLLNYLRKGVANGTFHIGDVPLATEQFMSLVLGGIRARLLIGVAKRPGVAERLRLSRQAAQIFLAGCTNVRGGQGLPAPSSHGAAEHHSQ